jgi:hypothetical protein
VLPVAVEPDLVPVHGVVVVEVEVHLRVGRGSDAAAECQSIDMSTGGGGGGNKKIIPVRHLVVQAGFRAVEFGGDLRSFRVCESRVGICVVRACRSVLTYAPAGARVGWAQRHDLALDTLGGALGGREEFARLVVDDVVFILSVGTDAGEAEKPDVVGVVQLPR